MRRVLGPVVLAVLAAASLWSLQHRDIGEPAGGPTAVAAAAQAAAAAPPATRNPPTGSESSTTTPSTNSPSASAEPAAAADDLVDPDPGGQALAASAAAIPRDPAQRDRFAAYEQAAAAFLTAFARPARTLTPQQWWTGVEPHLAARVVGDYAGTDPQQVSFTAVTGPGAVMPSDAPGHLLVLVLVPTDAGDYLVEMETDETGIHITRAAPAGAAGE